MVNLILAIGAAIFFLICLIADLVKRRNSSSFLRGAESVNDYDINDLVSKVRSLTKLEITIDAAFTVLFVVVAVVLIVAV